MTTTLKQLRRVLPTVCQEDTAYNARQWSAKNPLAEHCTVVALLAQDLFGGQLLRVKIHPSGRFPKGGWHWYNRLPDGRTVDLTKKQFGKQLPRFSKPIVRYRGSILRIDGLEKRYRTLRRRTLKAIREDNK